jgi:hypothetical protein
MEIVEHDALDAVAGDGGNDEPQTNKKTTAAAKSKPVSEPVETGTSVPENAAPAEVGEIAFIRAKFKALKQTSVSDVLTEAGITRLLGEDYKDMNKAEFAALKLAVKGKK